MSGPEMDKYQRWREWFNHHAGWNEAQRRIATEARALHVNPLSNTALKHALATYQAETGKSPISNETHEQEGLWT